MVEAVNAFQRIIDEEIEQFVAASTAFGLGVMETLAALVKDAFEAELAYIRRGVAGEKPNDEELQRLTEPIVNPVRKINEASAENWRNNKTDAKELENHFSTISNAIQALNWISVPKTPVQFIKDMKEAGDYYGNRVLTANKGNDLHITWIHKWNAVMTALEGYVKKYYLTGFTWKLTGSAQVPPPPPPPPPRERNDYYSVGDATSPPAYDSPELRADRAALMMQLNQGVDIQRILRPITRRDGSPPLYDFPEVRPEPRVQARRNAPPPAVHPPVFILEGKKWRIEYQGNENLEVNPENKSESLAMFQCQGTTVRSTAKMNAVTIDNCKRCVVIVSHIISSVELIRCERVKVQCDGSCPNITLDNCDSVQIFLYDSAVECEVISSKSTSTNICRLTADGDYVEFPVPEQIKSVLVNNKLQSSVVEHCM